MPVYFIGADMPDCLIKIGWAENVEDRLACLQACSPVMLTVVAVMLDAKPEVERWLHRRHKAARSHGEWFRPTPEVLADVSAAAAGQLTAPPLRPISERSFPVINKLGGAKIVAPLIVETGLWKAFSPDTIRMWGVRGRIPGKAMPLLMRMAEQRAIAISPRDFVLTPQQAA